MGTKDDNRKPDAAEIEIMVRASQRGDSNAFAKIYDCFVNPIYRYIYYRVGANDAEDMTELVFLKTWEHIEQYKPGQGSFNSWVFRIAHNVIIDHYRSERENGELSEEIEDMRKEANTAHSAHNHFDKEILNRAMRELKDHYRQILVLKYMNEFSNDEIGHIMGRSQAGLRILQFRALRALKRVLERMGFSALDL